MPGSQASVVVLPAGDARSTDVAYKGGWVWRFQLPAIVFLVPIDASVKVPTYQIRWYTAQGVVESGL